MFNSCYLEGYGFSMKKHVVKILTSVTCVFCSSCLFPYKLLFFFHCNLQWCVSSCRQETMFDITGHKIHFKLICSSIEICWKKKKSWLNPSVSSSSKICLSVCISSYSAQQQANLIPGLNLNALGIFSSGLPVLPPAAGPRGAVPPVAPAGYNPFLVSVPFFFSLNHKRWRKKEMKNPSFRMTLPPLFFYSTLLLWG